LSSRQERFVQAYLVDPNATKAAIEAGYTASRAHITGSELVRNRKVGQEIARREAEIHKKLEITAERVKAAIAVKAFATIEDYVVHVGGDIAPDLSKCTKEQMAAIQEFTVDSTGGVGDGERKMYFRTRVKLADSLRALELLGRTRDLNLFTDNKVEVTFSDEVIEAIAEGHKRQTEWRQQRQLPAPAEAR
jgi:phage terminase small subunit